MSDVIFLSNVRLSFPNLAQPQVQKNELTGVERVSYNCEFIMPQEHPGLAQFMQRYATMAQENWKEHAQTVMQMIQSDRKLRCFGAGQEKVNSRTFQPYDGYQGMYFITVGNKNRPQMIELNGEPAIAKRMDGSPMEINEPGYEQTQLAAYLAVARKLYGGCRVNAAVRPWLQENKHGRGIRCDLIAVQFAADDKPFGESAPDVSNLFGATQAPAAVPSFAAAPQMPAAPFLGVQGTAAPSFATPTMPWAQ